MSELLVHVSPALRDRPWFTTSSASFARKCKDAQRRIVNTLCFPLRALLYSLLSNCPVLILASLPSRAIGSGSSCLCRIRMKVSVAGFALTATTLQNEEVRGSRWRTSSGSSVGGEDGDPRWECVSAWRGRSEHVRTFTTESLTSWLRKRDKDDLVLWIRYSTYQRSPDLHPDLSKDPAAGSSLSTLTVIPVCFSTSRCLGRTACGTSNVSVGTFQSS